MFPSNVITMVGVVEAIILLLAALTPKNIFSDDYKNKILTLNLKHKIKIMFLFSEINLPIDSRIFSKFS